MEDPISVAASEMATAVAKSEDAAVRLLLDSFHGPNNWTMQEALTHLRRVYNPYVRGIFHHHRRWFLFWDEIPLAEIRTIIETHPNRPHTMVATTTVKSAFGRSMPMPGREAG